MEVGGIESYLYCTGVRERRLREDTTIVDIFRCSRLVPPTKTYHPS
jgi:hypothetical protein